MSTYDQRKTAAPARWTPQQSAAFTRALDAWVTREGLTHARAAAKLGVSDVHLGQWLAGNRAPSPDEVTRVLTIIAG